MWPIHIITDLISRFKERYPFSTDANNALLPWAEVRITTELTDVGTCWVISFIQGNVIHEHMASDIFREWGEVHGQFFSVTDRTGNRHFYFKVHK